MRALRLPAAAALVIALAGVSCSSDDDTSPTCKDFQDLQRSVDDMRNVDITTDEISGLLDAVNAVESSAEDLRATAGDEFGSAIDTLAQALTELRDAIGEANTSDVSGSIDSLSSATANVQSAWQQLETTAEEQLSDCDL